MEFAAARHGLNRAQQVFQRVGFAKEVAAIIAEGVACFSPRQGKPPPMRQCTEYPHRIGRLADSGPAGPHMVRRKAAPKPVDQVDIGR